MSNSEDADTPPPKPAYLLTIVEAGDWIAVYANGQLDATSPKAHGTSELLQDAQARYPDSRFNRRIAEPVASAGAFPQSINDIVWFAL